MTAGSICTVLRLYQIQVQSAMSLARGTSLLSSFSYSMIALSNTNNPGPSNHVLMRNYTSYADRLGLRYLDGATHRNFLQFADGSIEETVGQLKGHWTFVSGECATMTFEVLERCCANVIIGEEVLWRYEVFEKHASSIITCSGEGSHNLAPFDLVTAWHRKLSAILEFTAWHKKSKCRWMSFLETSSC